MAGQRLAADFLQVPAVTRAYTAACVLTTAAVQLELLSPFQLYFNPHLVFRKFQCCRFRYCRMLEEGSFRGRKADFVFMFLFGGVLMTLLGFLGSMFFLGQALMAMLVYVWSRRSPHVRVNFFGLLNFQAPFLPWALMGFSLLLGNSVITDLLGEPARSGATHPSQLLPSGSALPFPHSSQPLILSQLLFWLMPLKQSSWPTGFASAVDLLNRAGPAWGWLVSASWLLLLQHSQAPSSCPSRYWPLLGPFKPPFKASSVLFRQIAGSSCSGTWVLLGCERWPLLAFGSLTGIIVGHIYYFLEDVFPNQPGGKRLLLTPSFLKLLLDDPQEDPNYLPLPEEHPEA
eukprot:XP_008771144.1 PREDICTED: derlin-3 isoform X4 [Rattus norvegicus]